MGECLSDSSQLVQSRFLNVKPFWPCWLSADQTRQVFKQTWMIERKWSAVGRHWSTGDVVFEFAFNVTSYLSSCSASSVWNYKCIKDQHGLCWVLLFLFLTKTVELCKHNILTASVFTLQLMVIYWNALNEPKQFPWMKYEWIRWNKWISKLSWSPVTDIDI